MPSIRHYSLERSRLEGYVPLEHPLRRVRAVIDGPLGTLNSELRALEAPDARGAIKPEQIVRAVLLQFLLAMRSDRQLLDQIWFSMLFRWFVGIGIDEVKWDPETYRAHRRRCLMQDSAHEVLLQGLAQGQRDGLISFAALQEVRSELAEYLSHLTTGVGQPGKLPTSR